MALLNKRQPMDTIKFTARIPAELKAYLRELSKINLTSINAELVSAVKQAKKLREAKEGARQL